MELKTISQISKMFNLSTRTLRYYEKIGLIESERKENYAYRVYSEDMSKRLQQIIILRKLRIPLKTIAEILQNHDAQLALDVFCKTMHEVNGEIAALSTIRSILNVLIERLNQNMHMNLQFDMLENEDLLKLSDTLTITKIDLKERNVMSELNAANEKINKLTDKDVRIIYLPPATVASIHCIGGKPEWETGELAKEFVKTYRLAEIKPDFRHYGFNHPTGTNDDNHGYERWITIPDDLEIKAPFVKKHFQGGLYGAHMIPMGAFEEWQWLLGWAYDNERYDCALIEDGGECMNGLLEEHLNFINLYDLPLTSDEIDSIQQLDLLVPIKQK